MQIPGLIVKKVGMTRMVDGEGRMIPVTLVQADNQKVTKILNPDRDGYHAVQIGYYIKPEFRLNKPDVHRLRKVGIADNFSRMREIRLQGTPEGVELGHELNVESFADVGAVDVTGISKGRGFQGAPKRWNSRTGRNTHGSRFHRRPGSLGSNTTPGRVYKNKKMPGHLGNESVTIQNLKIVDVDNETRVIALKGSIPGHRDGYLVLRPSVKIKDNAKAES
jgi:large subunit ribosomal protein L3